MERFKFKTDVVKQHTVCTGPLEGGQSACHVSMIKTRNISQNLNPLIEAVVFYYRVTLAVLQYQRIRMARQKLLVQYLGDSCPVDVEVLPPCILVCHHSLTGLPILYIKMMCKRFSSSMLYDMRTQEDGSHGVASSSKISIINFQWMFR